MMTTPNVNLRDLGRDVIERVARKVILEGDRSELEAWYSLMREVSERSLAAGDLQGAYKTAEANQSFAVAVKRAADELTRGMMPLPARSVALAC